MLADITIKKVRSAKTIRLRVMTDGKVVVTCHPLTPNFVIKSFVSKHQDWITEKTSEIKLKRRALTEKPKVLLFRGKRYHFKLQISAKKSVKISTDSIIVSAKREDDSEIREQIEAWYKLQAKAYLSERTKLLCDLVDRDVVAVTIRSQQTRWGSCTSRNTISLNWRLIQAPDWVSDYVIYHELAHLTHMNHSSKFWRLVEDYYPNFKKAEQWLSENHELLHF
ncbi:M48 family metallopeptidase [Candidatus Berkelbacteria bacterium]|nr:M48 family metallopeptidase [Candidatus Berkelbacteria bacterium]